MNLQTLTVTPLSWNQAHNKKIDPLISIHRVDMSNMTLFTFVSLRPLPEDYEPGVLDLPTTKYKTKGKKNQVIAKILQGKI
jgi:hypothetical protein